jgi:hypothetical protein
MRAGRNLLSMPGVKLCHSAHSLVTKLTAPTQLLTTSNLLVKPLINIIVIIVELITLFFNNMNNLYSTFSFHYSIIQD